VEGSGWTHDGGRMAYTVPGRVGRTMTQGRDLARCLRASGKACTEPCRSALLSRHDTLVGRESEGEQRRAHIDPFFSSNIRSMSLVGTK
jgi:hypothetical protein